MIIHQPHNSISNHTYNAFFYRNCEWFYHFHKNYELIYVLDGQVELTLNGTKYCINKNTFALLFPNEFHALHTPLCSYVWIGVFSADFVSEFAALTEGKHAETPLFYCESSIKQFLMKYLIHEYTPDTFLLKSLLYAACREFLNQVLLTTGPKEKNFIYEIISYVSEKYQENISLISLAEYYGYEYHYLSRQFHSLFHMNFKDFLNTYRLEHARNLLLHSEKNITEVALCSGFQTMRTFNRVFLQQTGMTPTEFRNSHLHLIS